MAPQQTYEQQSWFDISVWIYGTADHALALAAQNHYSLTDEVPAGIIVHLPDLPQQKAVLAALKQVPATAVTPSEILFPSLGIGSMIIETTFTVG